MFLPTLNGYIDRRILINYVADPEIAARHIPSPFRPKLYKDKAIVGICLIRLKNIKPKGFPDFVGISSENGAHRFAVEWEEDGVKKEGVYIPRRDTSLRFNAFVGGKLFPGKHYLADFNVKEENGNYHVDFRSSDSTIISIDANSSEEFNSKSIFESLENVSSFFEKGSIGYSPNGNEFEAMKLNTIDWKVTPLNVSNVHSSFFEDEHSFPAGSIQFDNAILMTNLRHEWHSVKKRLYHSELKKNRE